MEKLVKLGQAVIDRWYPAWGRGKVIKATPSIVNVMFPVGKRTYTARQFMYLQPIKPQEAVSWPK